MKKTIFAILFAFSFMLIASASPPRTGHDENTYKTEQTQLVTAIAPVQLEAIDICLQNVSIDQSAGIISHEAVTMQAGTEQPICYGKPILRYQYRWCIQINNSTQTQSRKHLQPDIPIPKIV